MSLSYCPMNGEQIYFLIQIGFSKMIINQVLCKKRRMTSWSEQSTQDKWMKRADEFFFA